MEALHPKFVYRSSGEPCAVKAASTVWRGVYGKAPVWWLAVCLPYLTMKRIMICGMGAGIAYYTAQFLVPICSLPTLIVAFMAMLYATGNRYGVSRFRWIIDDWRGRLLINARRNSTGISAKMCAGFGWDASVVVVYGDKLYASEGRVNDDWSGIQIMDSDDPDGGGFELLEDG